MESLRKFCRTLTLQPLLLFEKKKETPKTTRVFLFAEPLKLKSLEKKGQNAPKSKGNRKTKNARKSKKARIGGSGKVARLRFIASGKGAEICRKCSARTPSRTTPLVNS